MIPVIGFEGRSVAVLGLGRTGLTAARALMAGGARVALWDEKPAAREAAAKEGFDLIDLTTADWTQFDALMQSPGVPLTHPRPHWTVEKARAAGVEILGDIELFAQQAALHPQAIALRHQETTLTYAQLDSAANQLARHLVLQGIGPDVIVGLLLPRSPS